MTDPGRCTGKHRFTSPGLAMDVAAKAPSRVKPYRCEDCGGWHIGAFTKRGTTKRKIVR